MFIKTTKLFPQAIYWRLCEAGMPNDAKICSPIQRTAVLNAMCCGLEELGLITPEDRFNTVGGTTVANPRTWHVASSVRLLAQPARGAERTQLHTNTRRVHAVHLRALRMAFPAGPPAVAHCT